MAAVSIKAKLSTEDLLDALEQLGPRDADRVTDRLLQLRARRKAPVLSERESELLTAINKHKRAGFQERFDLLNDKRREDTLTPEERQELIRLSDESETFAGRRLEALIELARLRCVTVSQLMKQLGIKAPPVV